MPLATRRRLLFALLIGLLFLAIMVVVVGSRTGLQSRFTDVKIGMTQAEVETILGPPILVLQRTNGRGHASAWVDQFWQIDVITGPDGRVERVGCVPSDSAFRRTIGRLL